MNCTGHRSIYHVVRFVINHNKLTIWRWFIPTIYGHIPDCLLLGLPWFTTLMLLQDSFSLEDHATFFNRERWWNDGGVPPNHPVSDFHGIFHWSMGFSRDFHRIFRWYPHDYGKLQAMPIHSAARSACARRIPQQLILTSKEGDGIIGFFWAKSLLIWNPI